MLRKNPIETGEKCSVYKVSQLERCAVHRDGTCSVIKPTGLPSADDIWGINLTRRQLRDLSRALLGRLSCYHTDSGNGFHCWRDIRFPKQFHSEVTLLQIHIGWHIRFCEVQNCKKSHHHLNVFWRGSSFDFDPIKVVDFAVVDQWGLRNMGAVSNYLSVLLALWERKGVGRGGSFNHNFAKLCSESPNWPPPSSQPLFLAI